MVPLGSHPPRRGRRLVCPAVTIVTAVMPLLTFAWGTTASAWCLPPSRRSTRCLHRGWSCNHCRGQRLARSGTAAGAEGRSLGDNIVLWWNETYEFWEALELWNAPDIQDDPRPEAAAIRRQLDLVNATMLRSRKLESADKEVAKKELASQLKAVPGIIFAYYKMRLTSIFDKRPVKRGLTSMAVYANLILLVVFARVVAPRLLIADNLDEFFEAAAPLGLPNRASLVGVLESVAAYDTSVKVALYVIAFIIEKLFMLTEFLPIQIGLKTLAPIVFGGLVQGALASAATETLAAACNFLIGKTFLSDRVRSFSVFGSDPLGKATWFGALERSAEQDGLRLTLLLRLAPVLPLPFDSYWYLLGALPTGLPEFAIAHFLGCLKTAFLDASFGMLLFTSIGSDGSVVQSQAQQIVLVESVAFAVVALLISTVATRLINEMLGLDEEKEPDAGDLQARRVD